MARPKPASKIREGDEFAMAKLKVRLEHQRTTSSLAIGWTVESIFAARNAQMAGQFATAHKLAVAMKTDDALYVAHENRLAPQRAVSVEIVPASPKPAARKIAEEAEALFGIAGIGVSVETLDSIEGCLVDHGVAFAFNEMVARDDGSRVDLFVRYWPIEFVRWDAYRRAYLARLDGGAEEEICHGDGRWIVFEKRAHEPWLVGAIVPGSVVWSRHAFAMHDWTKGSKSHGDAKILGELPEGVSLQGDAAGTLSAEAEAMLSLLDAFQSGASATGLKPAGSTVEFVANTSTAWQVWNELAAKAEKAAARIYLGTDGTLGSQGGAPGVDVTALFGVATTFVQGDIGCIERALKTGAIDVWTALNFGDSSLAPTRRYMLPDADEAAERDAKRVRRVAFFADIAATRANGFVVDQSYVDQIAQVFDVEPPTLPEPSDSQAPTIALAPTDLANVVRVNEARASAGLSALVLSDGTPDPDGMLMLGEFAAKLARAAATPAPMVGESTTPPDPSRRDRAD